MAVRWNETEHRLVCVYPQCGVVITGPAKQARQLMKEHRAGHRKQLKARRGK